MKWLQQRGVLLIASVVLITIIGLLVSVVNYLFVGGSAASSDHLRSAQALFVAQSGLEYAAYQYKVVAVAPCASQSYTQTVGLGSFSTTAAANSVSSPLSSAIAATDTVIPLASTVNFGAHGRITISSEAVNYAATANTGAACAPYTAPCLTGAKRGRMETTAASYSSGTAVTQSQCMVTSTGTVGLAQRVLEGSMLP